MASAHRVDERRKIMTKYIHCAFVKHDLCDTPFLFSVGREENVRGGTRVECETCRGRVQGTVFGDSFMISEEALKSLCPAVGATLPLRDIVGIVETVQATQTAYFDGYHPTITEIPF